jgi:hypothetical protein
VRVGVVDGPVPAVSLVVEGGQRVVVLGEQGEPMARIGEDGSEFNLASPTWMPTAAAGGDVPDGRVGAGAPPRWEVAGPGRALTWLEPRALYPQGVPPAEVLERGAPTLLQEWVLPLEVDGERIELAGTTEWLPLDLSDPGSGGRTPFPGWFLAAGATVLVLLALFTRLPRRGPSGGDPAVQRDPAARR